MYLHKLWCASITLRSYEYAYNKSIRVSVGGDSKYFPMFTAQRDDNNESWLLFCFEASGPRKASCRSATQCSPLHLFRHATSLETKFLQCGSLSMLRLIAKLILLFAYSGVLGKVASVTFYDARNSVYATVWECSYHNTTKVVAIRTYSNSWYCRDVSLDGILFFSLFSFIRFIKLPDNSRIHPWSLRFLWRDVKIHLPCPLRSGLSGVPLFAGLSFLPMFHDKHFLGRDGLFWQASDFQSYYLREHSFKPAFIRAWKVSPSSIPSTVVAISPAARVLLFRQHRNLK